MKRLLPLFIFLLAAAAHAAEPPVLRIHIVDGKGRPVAGAEVRAGQAPRDDQHDPVRPENVVSGKTSRLGEVRLAGLSPGRTVWVMAAHKGFTPEARSLTLAQGEPPRGLPRDLRIVLRPGGMAVGRVVDERGRPVAGAEVELTGDAFGLRRQVTDIYGALLEGPLFLPTFLREAARLRARTGPAGRFRFRDLPEGRYRLAIRHRGFEPFFIERPLRVAAGSLGSFVLERSTLLTGTVTDPDGAPVAGARIWYDEEDDLAPTATTAADGTFEILSWGPRRVFAVSAEGFLEEWVDAEYEAAPLQVSLRPAAFIRGRVLGVSGEPLAGATVHPCNVGSMYGGEAGNSPPCTVETPTVSGAGGEFVLGPLLPGWYEIRARVPGLQDGVAPRVQAAGGETAEDVEIRLRPGSRVAGTVLDEDGEPVPGATLEAWTGTSVSQTVAGDDGSFRLEGVGSGRGSLHAEADGYWPGSLSVLVEEEESSGWVVTLRKKYSIEVRGHVLDPDGLPVGAALVSVPGGDANPVHSADDGTFAIRIPEHTADGDLLLQAEKSGFVPAREIVAPDRHPLEDLELRLQTGALVIGRVTGLDQRELASAYIADAEGNRELDSRAEPVDASGTFRIGPVPAGAWRATVTTPEGSKGEARVEIEPGDSEVLVEVEVPPVYTVSGRVLGPEGPVPGIYLDISDEEGGTRWSARTRADGTFSLRAEDGSWVLTAWGHDVPRTLHPVEIDGGPVSDVEILLEPGVTVRGRFRDLAEGEIPIIYLSDGSTQWRATVELDGRWSVSGLTAGTWNLSAFLPSEHSFPPDSRSFHQTVEIPPGVTEIELELDFAEPGSGVTR